MCANEDWFQFFPCLVWTRIFIFCVPTVASNQQNVHVLHTLLDDLKKMINNYYCWGRPLGSTQLWEQHLQTLEKICQKAASIQIKQVWQQSRKWEREKDEGIEDGDSYRFNTLSFSDSPFLWFCDNLSLTITSLFLSPSLSSIVLFNSRKLKEARSCLICLRNWFVKYCWGWVITRISWIRQEHILSWNLCWMSNTFGENSVNITSHLNRLKWPLVICTKIFLVSRMTKQTTNRCSNSFAGLSFSRCKSFFRNIFLQDVVDFTVLHSLS